MKHDFKFFVKEGAGNMFSHGFMSFAAIGVTVACLLIMGTFTLVAYNANENLADLQQENAIVAFVDESLDEDQARALQSQVEAVANVADCSFVTRTEARDAYVAKYDDEDVYGDLLPEVFRHRYVIHVTDPDHIMDTKDAVEQVPGIAKARADEAVANGFVTVRNVAGVISIALIAILLLVSVFIISNTIKLTTFDRRDEIAIQRLHPLALRVRGIAAGRAERRGGLWPAMAAVSGGGPGHRVLRYAADPERRTLHEDLVHRGPGVPGHGYSGGCGRQPDRHTPVPPGIKKGALA